MCGLKKVFHFTVAGMLVLSLLSVNAYATGYAFGLSDFTATNNLNIDGKPFFNTDSGWINSLGVHNAGNRNYYSGTFDCIGLNVCRNYFSFDFSSMTEAASSATLNILTYAITGTETYEIFGTTLTPTGVYSGSGFTSVHKWTALAAGAPIGLIPLTPADSYSQVSIALNADGIAWLDAHAGDGAVVGGQFGDTLPSIPTTPEPSALLLLGTGLVMLFSATGFLKP